MAPSRGSSPSPSPSVDQSPTAATLATRASAPQNFTLRGVLVGLAIGVVICFSNTYFGLQTGWVSGMAMPSALLGFAWFRAASRWLPADALPFSPVENVLVQSVAGAVGTMPLGCGFVGVVPALEYLLLPAEGGPLRLPLSKLVVWAVGICFFGVVSAVPLRRQVIIREKLRFPSGTATALMIGVLHGEKGISREDDGGRAKGIDEEGEQEEDGVLETAVSSDYVARHDQFNEASSMMLEQQETEDDKSGDWQARIRLLLWSFAFSGLYVSSMPQHTSHQPFPNDLSDICFVLPSASPRCAHSRPSVGPQVAMDTEPLACLCWPGHHHGPGDKSAHVARRRRRLGHPLAASEAQRLGAGRR